MKHIIIILSISVLSLLILHCKDNTTDQKEPIQAVPSIVSISPTQLMIGDIIVISGSNFGTFQDTSFVLFNNIQATDYLIWSDSLIKTRTPRNTVSGKLSVTINGKKSNEVDFTIKNHEQEKYESIIIGNQTWMLKNLDVVTYRNGDTIPEVADRKTWANLKTGAWCYYNNDQEIGKIYGKLYNWHAVNDPRGLAPDGWHIPGDEEWKVLEIYLGMIKWEADFTGYRGSIEGGKLKSTGTKLKGDGLWCTPNVDATNETGFTGLPGGARDFYGNFELLTEGGDWWSSTVDEPSNAWHRYLSCDNSKVFRGLHGKVMGFSVRCVKD